MGSKSSIDEAISEFAVAYADQNQLDYKAFTNAIKAGRLKVVTDVAGLRYASGRDAPPDRCQARTPSVILS